MVHVPVARIVTVLIDTVHTLVVVEANVTARPEVAVAPTGKGASPSVRPASGSNAIV